MKTRQSIRSDVFVGVFTPEFIAAQIHGMIVHALHGALSGRFLLGRQHTLPFGDSTSLAMAAPRDDDFLAGLDIAYQAGEPLVGLARADFPGGVQGANSAEVLRTQDGMSDRAALYRMVTGEHICPFGLKARDLLRRKGYSLDDHKLESRQAADACMEKHGVETTPQVFIGDEDATTYQPVIAMAFLMALATSWAAFSELLTVRARANGSSPSACAS